MTDTANTAAPTLLPHLWKSALLSGLLAVILGALILFLPGKTLLATGILFGAYLLVSGISQVVFAFSLHVSAGGRILLFVSGAASLILAVLAFKHFGEGYAVLLLAIWIAIGFIFRGVATTVSAIQDSTLPGRGWNIFFGLVSLAAGIVTLAWPVLTLGTLFWVAGVWLVVTGFFEIGAAFAIRKTSRDLTS